MVSQANVDMGAGQGALMVCQRTNFAALNLSMVLAAT